MREFSLDTDADQIMEVLVAAEQQKLLAVVWQTPTAERPRKVTQGRLSTVDSADQSFRILNPQGLPLLMDSGDVYFYLPFMACIFRCKQTRSLDGFTTCSFPADLKILDQEDDQKIQQGFDLDFSELNLQTVNVGTVTVSKQDFFRFAGGQEKISTIWVTRHNNSSDTRLFEQHLEHLSLEEEDLAYGNVRSAPRARAKIKKMAVLEKYPSGNLAGGFQVFDLSRSGMSFLIDSEDAVELKGLLRVLAFDQNKFQTPMMIQVMNIRPMDDNPNQFKVGCRFLQQEEIDALGQ